MPVELTHAWPAGDQLHVDPARGDYGRPRGEEHATGDVLVGTGPRLRAVDVGGISAGPHEVVRLAPTDRRGQDGRKENP
jgi:molybdopterin biosynthesis enzyme